MTFQSGPSLLGKTDADDSAICIIADAHDKPFFFQFIDRDGESTDVDQQILSDRAHGFGRAASHGHQSVNLRDREFSAFSRFFHCHLLCLHDHIKYTEHLLLQLLHIVNVFVQHNQTYLFCQKSDVCPNPLR